MWQINHAPLASSTLGLTETAKKSRPVPNVAAVLIWLCIFLLVTEVELRLFHITPEDAQRNLTLLWKVES